MARGTVSFFHHEKGYGFIEADDADDDIFVHVIDITEPDPDEGDGLGFEIEQGDRGPRATKIKRL